MSDFKDKQIRAFVEHVERGWAAQKAVDEVIASVPPTGASYDPNFHPTQTGTCTGKHCEWHAEVKS